VNINRESEIKIKIEFKRFKVEFDGQKSLEIEASDS
jgi:hypothetical protein